jgi:hypothetical protein
MLFWNFILNHLNLIDLKKLPNILCCHVSSCTILQLVNGWKFLTITSDMWVFFAYTKCFPTICPMQLQSL